MKTINGVTFKSMIQSGCNNLNNLKATIDALNVFPVPDGDTGTNMSMTFSSGVKEINEKGSDNLSEICKTLSRGLLMGARGNSGVILSQIFRGFYKSVDGKEEINAKELAQAFMKGSMVAYKAVMRPVEGTILTVVRESSELALMHVEKDSACTVEEYFEVLCTEAKKSLDNTPDLLPVLKEVGVVDSGGTGLLAVFDGMKAALLGKPIESKEVDNTQTSAQAEFENKEFGYCTEFIVRLNQQGQKSFKEEKLRKSLSQLGESIVVVQDEDIVKVHVHTLTPGEALNLAQRYGEFVKIKIENMQEQHANLENGPHNEADSIVMDTKPVEMKEYAIIAVAAGEGLSKTFKDYRVDEVISGGQTMNPSTEDFISAISRVHAKHIFILPNNSNIIMAAKQAASVSTDQHIHVFDTKSIPQGLSACIMFNPETDFDSNVSEMQSAIEHVKTGSVTYAIKDTSYNGTPIASGDYMGIFEKDITVATKNKVKATEALLKKMIDENAEIITLICGEDATEKETNKIKDYIENNYDCEVDVLDGGQPVYSYFIGVE